MKEIIEILEKLKTLSGNEQLNYLKSHKDNQTLKEVLQYTYNPDLKFNINEAKLDKVSKTVLTTSDVKESDYTVIDKTIWESYKNALDELASKKGVKESDIISLYGSYFLRCEEKSKALLKGILFKDLRINMNVKLFLKVWSDFCNDMQVQLANKFNGKMFENPYFSRKFDGKRMYVMDGMPFSRTNKKCSVKPIEHILNELNKIASINEVVLDGECLYFDEYGNEDFQKGISLTSKDERENGCDNICYVIFDILPKENFVSKKPFVNFDEEYKMMLKLLVDESKTTPCYSLLPTKLKNIYIARQDTDMKKLSELRDKNNWEGLMVRNGNHPYEYKRTMSLLKLKKMLDDEFEIIGFTKGTGKFEDTLGAITIKLSTGESVEVGSGFSSDDRDYIWENKDLILNSGYKLKVQYFEKTTDKNGNNSLRFPVFKAFRKDDVEVMRI